MKGLAADALMTDEVEMSLEAAYQKRTFTYLFFVGAPTSLALGVFVWVLRAPWYVMGMYCLGAAILAGGFAAFLHPMEPRRFLRTHRLVVIAFTASLLASQVISIGVLNSPEFSPGILLYPSLALLFMGKRDGIPSVIVSGLAFFPLLFLSPYVAITPQGLSTLKTGLLLIFVLTAAHSAYIDATRRGMQSDLIRKQEDLARVTAAAEASSRAKSEFLGNMSHELRTPLNHIIGFTELLLETAAERHDDTSVEYLSDVLSSGRHLQVLVDDLLDLSQVEAGKLELHLSQTIPAELLTRSVRLVSERAREKGVTLTIDPDGARESIHVDPSRLTQVLVNLLVNAVKYTASGGSVTVGCRAVSVTGSGERAVEFHVSDTGIGIPPDKLLLLFERYSRLDQPQMRGAAGAGIGLALSRGLVERHGGRIWAESGGPGKGSTFTFTVPVR